MLFTQYINSYNFLTCCILFLGLTFNKLPSFMDYYKNLTLVDKQNLHTLGYKYPDEFFVLNMLTDR